VGLGLDVHRYAPPGTGGELHLACLAWPGQRPLAGHSDGDAAAHAVVDAIASAAGLGDIGGLYGTQDPRWAGASGAAFLTDLMGRLTAAGYRVGNVSVQIVANSPKIGARRAEAEAALSAIVRAPVNVAATTTDGLGLTGRGEGVAALATAVVLPLAG
jgi:2-C-methyl-D-erythritol 2,4-cyclodiphosphate synthase